ncbi:CvfB family protein [Rossellomorea aquimaris]|uniref:CvfB family protein n=1 Tax=Rossellomorea aquimaris TaxID=189382 RepID=UPI0007D0B4EB|nr:S1-like domain-containing RNA-binding protein [Rossellomorea aquimaris]
MSSLKPGTVVDLFVDHEVPYGFFLTDETEDRVLLHHSEITEEIFEGDTVKVFLYHDKEVRLTATMRIPKVQVGTYGWAEVVDKREDLGVFVNIGLPKDILVSADDLPKFLELWPNPGDQLFLTLNRDKQDRLYGRLATENIIEQVSRRAPSEMIKAQVQGRVYRLLRVGTFFLSEQGYRCFVHENERKEEPRLGELVTGRVIDVKDDGNLNVSFLPLKQDKMGEDAEVILDYLNQRNGAIPYWDKSLPDEIKDRFNMSKASFKRALGKLMKENLVYQEEGWTYLKK